MIECRLGIAYATLELISYAEDGPLYINYLFSDEVIYIVKSPISIISCVDICIYFIKFIIL